MVTEGGTVDAASDWRRLSVRLVGLYQQGWYSEATRLAEDLLDIRSGTSSRQTRGSLNL